MKRKILLAFVLVVLALTLVISTYAVILYQTTTQNYPASVTVVASPSSIPFTLYTAACLNVQLTSFQFGNINSSSSKDVVAYIAYTGNPIPTQHFYVKWSVSGIASGLSVQAHWNGFGESWQPNTGREWSPDDVVALYFTLSASSLASATTSSFTLSITVGN